MTPRRSTLARELLWNLSLLVGAALSLAVVTTLAAQALSPRWAVIALLGMIAADLAVLFVFGRYLIGRLVLTPLERLSRTADELAAGNLAVRAPDAETTEFMHLAERLNGMTETLLDTQAELVRAEKLAGVGRLAAGIAHEVGNPLAAIRTYTDVLVRRGVDPEVTRQITDETDRIDRIVRSLLDYARPSRGGEGVVEVARTIERVVDLLTAQGLLRDKDLRLHVASGLPVVRGPAHGLEQILVNLLLNAIDATPQGAIVIEAQEWTGDPRRRLRRAELEGVRGVLLLVADSGPGVPEADRERIFDPFVTSKNPGRGTGLGLAIVHRAVHEMGGVIWVEDAREGGAAFKMVLPAA
ncbi:MAG: ATP-binding protein [Gemmatimonadales bacterium]